MTFDRNTGIGGTDARRIMAGEWWPLWAEKTGRSPPEDLSEVFRVQLGKVTEPFHLAWIEKRQASPIVRGSTVWPETEGRMHDIDEPWRYITIDGWHLRDLTHVETKHSHSQMTIREAAEFYMGQLQHGLAITGKQWCWLSVIPGNDEPMTVQVERDDNYIARMLDLERSFWQLVKDDQPPEILPGEKIMAASMRASEILVGGFKADLDMSATNQWPMLVAEYTELKPKVARFDEVKEELKALVPVDRKRAFGNGVQIIRNKKGSLTLMEDKASADALGV